MSRCLNKPYRADNPRSVRGARKRGWTVVRANPSYVENASWLGLCIWAESRLSGYWVASFYHREFAFEQGADALAFQLKWG